MISGRFFGEIFYDEIYKPVKELGNIGTVIDLGACTGEFSLWIYPYTSKIYAIDANEQVFAHLKENTVDFPKIEPVFLAIAKNNEEARQVYGSLIGGSTLVHEVGVRVNKVEAQTLATFINENHISRVDCLKIDIENAESEIFEADDFLEIANKIKYIIGEHLQPVRKKLEDSGFEIEEYKHGLIAKRI